MTLTPNVSAVVKVTAYESRRPTAKLQVSPEAGKEALRDAPATANESGLLPLALLRLLLRSSPPSLAPVTSMSSESDKSTEFFGETIRSPKQKIARVSS